MLSEHNKKTAVQFGILDLVETLQKSVLEIDGVDDVVFDLDGFWSNIPQVILLPKYHIFGPPYTRKRWEMLHQIIKAARDCGLQRTSDRIEDYGEHFYIVTEFNSDQKKEEDSKMLLSEFVERTGFEPTADEYLKIEEAYYHFSGDKDAFCQAFIQDDGERKIYRARANEISRLKNQIAEAERQHEQAIIGLERRITDLQNALDKELEWKPVDSAGTNMEQVRYEQLAHSGRSMTDQEARELIAEECGFSPEKIIIRRKANTYEANKYYRMRVAAEYDRPPVYEATDWNYVRFDCAGYMYELVNGELRFYCC